jgi:hypothetical protein
VASSLSSFLCLCPFPVLQSPRFQGTFQKSVLEMPAFFHGEPRPTRLDHVPRSLPCVRVLWSLKPRRVMKVMFDLSSGKCFWVVSIPHHCFVHSTTGRSGSPFTLGAGLLVSTRRGVNEPSRQAAWPRPVHPGFNQHMRIQCGFTAALVCVWRGNTAQ